MGFGFDGSQVDNTNEEEYTYVTALWAWKEARSNGDHSKVDELELLLEEMIDDCPDDVVSHREILANDHVEEDEEENEDEEEDEKED